VSVPCSALPCSSFSSPPSLPPSFSAANPISLSQPRARLLPPRPRRYVRPFLTHSPPLPPPLSSSPLTPHSRRVQAHHALLPALHQGASWHKRLRVPLPLKGIPLLSNGPVRAPARHLDPSCPLVPSHTLAPSSRPFCKQGRRILSHRPVNLCRPGRWISTSKGTRIPRILSSSETPALSTGALPPSSPCPAPHTRPDHGFLSTVFCRTASASSELGSSMPKIAPRRPR
jgi:hypothetical protein